MARRTLLLGLLVTLGSPASALAAMPSRPASWDVGLMLGGPTGISARRWLGGPNSFDLAVGAGPGFRLHGDYLLGLARPLSGADASLDLYLGGGALLAIGRGFCGYYRRGDYCGGDLLVGARVPLGFDVRLRKAPVSLGIEVAPGLAFGPERLRGLLDAFLFVRFVVGP